MDPHFQTPKALIGQDANGNPIYDYDACIVPQLLLRRDDRLNDPSYALPTKPNAINPCRADAAYFKHAMATFEQSLEQQSIERGRLG